ncbi:DNA polymerase V subunit UmuC [Methylophilus sp. Leaf414]|nr:DNA polymerase V subunit UmuC [Methylophilus sp. Leaf414]
MYASCEEVFRPDIRGKPVVVLSNNDGCVIAQNKLAKEILDIYMARPFFEIKEIAEKLGTIVFSSNYELYANMSNRFAKVLSRYSPRMEKYSIDEVFLEMTGIHVNYTDYGQKIKQDVVDSTGLPICVGFGYTKTLAKLANHCAKKQDQWNGVCDFTVMSETEIDTILAALPVSKVWGVGRRLEEKLNKLGVLTVLRLKNADPKRIRDEFGVLLERTVRELNGEVWIEMEDEIPEAKQVMSSRSFASRVSSIEQMREVITYHASMAADRMRKKDLYANGVYVFMMNSPYDKAARPTDQWSIGFPAPTNSTLKINKAAQYILNRIFHPGVYYQKAGVMLLDTVPAGGLQTDLFGYSQRDEKADSLMDVMDRINNKYSRGTIWLASEGTEESKQWAMQRNFKSPNYTGSWDELMLVK